MYQIRERPISERPRERILRLGVERLADHELVAAMLGTGIKGRDVGNIATDVLRLLDQPGGAPPIETLRALPGLGSAKAAMLAASFELARRILLPSRNRIAVPSDVLPLIRRYADRPQEHFLCLSLNGAHEVTRVRVVSVGLVNRTIVHPREVYADALTDRAAAIIAAHNHPSGHVAPSQEDRMVTERLRQAGETLGVRLLDHVVFSHEQYFSFLEEGLL